MVYGGLQVNYLDLCGAATALAATVFFVFSSIWAWPLSLSAVIIDLYLYYKSGIYGDMTLQVYFGLSSVYGWWRWSQEKGAPTEKAMQYLTTRGWVLLLSSLLLTSMILAEFLRLGLRSTVPMMDAVTTLLSVAAQYLMCQRYIETWIFWFAVDILYIALFIAKGLPFHSAIIPIYLCLAVMGYWRWKIEMEKKQHKSASECE